MKLERAKKLLSPSPGFGEGKSDREWLMQGQAAGLVAGPAGPRAASPGWSDLPHLLRPWDRRQCCLCPIGRTASMPYGDGRPLLRTLSVGNS